MSDKHMRQKERYEFVWNLIERIIGAGLGVWVTDANKLWLNPDEAHILTSSELAELKMLQREVLRGELKLVGPELTIAFGSNAQGTLGKYGIPDTRHPHPGVYGGKPLVEGYGLENGNFGCGPRLASAWRKIERDLATVRSS